jgi:hypothetical protein
MSLHVLAYNFKRMITIFGVGPLMAAIRNLIASRKPREPVDQTGVSTVTAGKHAASLSSHNTFSHGLGQEEPFQVRS